MAPKGKAKAQGQGMARKMPPPPGALGRLPPNFFDPNVEWFATVSAAVKTIQECEVFGEGISTAPALPMVAGEGELAGFLEPFSLAMLQAKVAAKSPYVCGVNALWANPLQSVTPGVPLLPQAIHQLGLSLWRDGPRPMEHRLEIQAPAGAPKFGELVRISPEEPQHALILNIAERIQGGAPEQELLKWKQALGVCRSVQKNPNKPLSVHFLRFLMAIPN